MSSVYQKWCPATFVGATVSASAGLELVVLPLNTALVFSVGFFFVVFDRNKAVDLLEQHDVHLLTELLNDGLFVHGRNGDLHLANRPDIVFYNGRNKGLTIEARFGEVQEMLFKNDKEWIGTTVGWGHHVARLLLNRVNRAL